MAQTEGLAELKADIMRCAKYAKTTGALTRCGRFLPGPGKPVGTKRKKKYRYSTEAGRKARKGKKGKRKAKR